MTPTEKQKMRDSRAVFDLLDRKPRIKYTEIAKTLDVDIRIASSRLREAIERGIIVGPQIRKKSFSNLKSYVSFVDSDDPVEMYERYMEDKNVIYHSILDGFCNFRVVSEKPLNIRGSVLEGVLPDYFLSYPPDCSWGIAIDTMREMVANFDPADYLIKGYIRNHWNEMAVWSEEYEILYQEFKYDLRRLLQPLSRKTGISLRKIKDFLKSIREYCTILTCFYPESLPAYDAYVYTFETDYEDFIIDVISQLPTTSWFYKVSDRLIAHIRIMRGLLKETDVPTRNVTELQIPLLIRDLKKKEILKSESHATFKCYWRRRPK